MQCGVYSGVCIHVRCAVHYVKKHLPITDHSAAGPNKGARVRYFLWIILAVLLWGVRAEATNRPNVILMMADDLGWGDVSFNNGQFQTPHVDHLARNGLLLRRFYSGGSVCSPTRGSCLTGRNPLRLGIPDANAGRIEPVETLLPEVLSAAGYRTGHFGKWHLGTLTTLRRDANRGAVGNTNDYSPPWWHGYDDVFVTESKVPTWHPMRKTVNGTPLPTSFSDTNYYGTSYWMAPTNKADWPSAPEGFRVPVTDNMAGDDSRVMMDRVIPFIQSAVASNEPFFAVVWFHTPHKPLTDPAEVAGVDSLTAYRAAVTNMDNEVGRLRTELAALGVLSNTMIWFCSDNGPETGVGSAGPFRDRKRALYEGGVRVPAFLHWPARIPAGRTTDFAAVTSDYYPTVLDYLGTNVPGQFPLDGISLRGLIDSNETVRAAGIGFEYNLRQSWVTHQYKLITVNSGSTYELYDLLADPYEKTNRASALPAVRDTMIAALTNWRTAVANDPALNPPAPPDPNLDTDGDGLPDLHETDTGIYISPTDTGSNPFLPDTDSDGWNDGIEVRAGSDPNNPNFLPVAGNFTELRLTAQSYITVSLNGTLADPMTSTGALAWGAAQTNDLFVRQRLDSGQPERRANAYLAFDLAPVTGAVVSAARLEMRQFDRVNSLSNASPLEVARVVAPWDLSGTNYPLFAQATADARVIGTNDQFGTNQFSAGTYTGSVSDIVNTWLANPATNHGVQLRLTNPTTTGAAFIMPLAPTNAPALVITRYVRDLDGDGLGDAWEILHFGSVTNRDGTLDYDGDGLSDAEEEITGTAPTNSASALGIALSEWLPDGLRIQFSSEYARRYAVFGSTNIAAGWQPLFTNVAPTPPSNAATVPGTNGLYFLRIGVEMGP